MTERDKRILELMNRYRLGTNATLQRMAFEGQSLNAVAKVTARLSRQNYLNRYPLFPPQQYFTLGPRSIQQLGLPVRRSQPLGPQALPMDFAVLLYAASGNRIRLTAEELRQEANWLPEQLLHLPHCKTENGLLELVRVDLGGSVRNIVKKLSRDCSVRNEMPEFQTLLAKGNFQLVILTTTNSKARLIRQAIEAMTWTAGIRLHLAVVPNLAQLHFRKF